MTFLKLFFEFFKIGLFAVGGGPATIPFLQDLARSDYGWFNEDQLGVMIAIAESTPGPIAINSATFIGYKIGGIFGSFCATFGVVLPSFTIISIISLVLREFSDIKAVQYAFNGIRAGVLALIIKALVSMYKKAPKNIFSYILMGASFFLAAFTDINVIFVIIGCGLAGLINSFIIKRRVKE